jgi:TfoX/Sxy family transcriptional regulator of competence genes
MLSMLLPLLPAQWYPHRKKYSGNGIRGQFEELPMQWKKVSEELTSVLENALAPFDCERRKMFGCPAFFIHDNMFAGVFADSIFIRLSEKDREELQKTFDEAAPFEPIPGRIMKEYMTLPEPVITNSEVLHDWLECSWQYARSLPPKEKKSVRKKKELQVTYNEGNSRKTSKS